MPTPLPRPQPFAASYAAQVAVIPAARAAFSGWLGELGIDGTHAGEMTLVLDELLANAVNASDEQTGDVGVEAWVDGNSLELQVTNPTGPVFPSLGVWDYEDSLRAGGRGLLIVEALVDDLAVTPPDGSQPLHVRCRWDLPADGA